MNKLYIIPVVMLAGALHIGIVALGLTDGKLSPCNGAWNCAITQEVHGQQPNANAISYKGSREQAVIILKSVIESLKRVEIISESDEYIHATVTSKLFGFVDDVEFYIPKDEKVIHVRSAARTGIYDFGVNKQRIRTIKSRFEAQGI